MAKAWSGGLSFTLSLSLSCLAGGGFFRCGLSAVTLAFLCFVVTKKGSHLRAPRLVCSGFDFDVCRTVPCEGLTLACVERTWALLCGLGCSWWSSLISWNKSRLEWIRDKVRPFEPIHVAPVKIRLDTGLKLDVGTWLENTDRFKWSLDSKNFGIYMLNAGRKT